MDVLGENDPAVRAVEELPLVAITVRGMHFSLSVTIRAACPRVAFRW